jgi:hypothetical protein
VGEGGEDDIPHMKGGLKHFLAEAAAVKSATRVIARNFILLLVLECCFGWWCVWVKVYGQIVCLNLAEYWRK